MPAQAPSQLPPIPHILKYLCDGSFLCEFTTSARHLNQNVVCSNISTNCVPGTYILDAKDAAKSPNSENSHFNVESFNNT